MNAAVGMELSFILPAFGPSVGNAIILVKREVGRFVAKDVDGDFETSVRLDEFHGLGQRQQDAAFHKQRNFLLRLCDLDGSSTGDFFTGPIVMPVASGKIDR